jgi:membrane protein
VTLDGWRRVVAAVDRWQQRWRPAAFVVGVVRKFSDDRAGRSAALIAYYGFFSLFPLLLVAVTIVGFVGGDRQWVKDSALAQFPIVGRDLKDQVHPLSGSVGALMIGLVGALWAALGCMNAAQDGVNAVWGVPRREQPNFLWKRWRALGALVVVGLTLVVGAAVTQVTALVPHVPGLGRVIAFVLSAGLNATLFALAYQVLATGRQRWRDLLAGGVVGGIGYMTLQLLGTWFIGRRLKGASNTYGTFALVIGLLTWLYVLGQLTLVAAEVIVVRADHLWPRSLTGPPRTRADHEVAARVAAVNDLVPEA